MPVTLQPTTLKYKDGQTFVSADCLKGDPGSPGDPTQLIDDTAGSGDTDKTWSADKLSSKADVANPNFTGSISMGRVENTTVGEKSTATGTSVTASGQNSHAEGYGTTASGSCSSAEGNQTFAVGDYSHSQGYGTRANGDASSAEGNGTVANGANSSVSGMYNIPDSYVNWPDWAPNTYYAAGAKVHLPDEEPDDPRGEYFVCNTSHTSGTAWITYSFYWDGDNGKMNYAQIVGNGSNYLQQSNAYTLDWNGNGSYAGDVTINKGTAEEVSISELKTEINSGKDELHGILVETGSEQITLTNNHNADNFYSMGGSLKGLEKTSIIQGIAKYTSKSENEKNPYVTDTNGNREFGEGKWLVGMKMKFTKLDQDLGDPSCFSVRLGAGSTHQTQLTVDWNEWITYSDLVEISLTRIYVSADGFDVAPADGQFTLEIKDLYVYEVSDASADMIAYIRSQQATNYQDGTVQYSIGTDGHIPDTTLTIEGKAADAKAVGDTIANMQKTAFDGMAGVAFGTSLTSRSVSSDGYMDFLPELMGIEFDNQGIGSSMIKGNLLTAIKNYTGYSNKKVCIIEGFVNDWKFDSALGTWNDSTENSACGCVRSAINYILAQNPNITIFLVLDHYGRNYSSDDRSSTALNSANLTQFEYYEEIAKVAESLGIPVIKQYAESQISENTPQYLYDYIHVNALGAEQSAYCIYSKMRHYFPNKSNLT